MVIYTVKSTSNILEVLKAKPYHAKVLSKRYPFFQHLKSRQIACAAKKVTVEEAAGLSGLSKQSLLDFLNLNQDSYNLDSVSIAEENVSQEEVKNKDMNRNENKEIVFDVRPLLSKGQDPFSEIQKRVKKLKNRQKLTIVSDFRPLPLQRLLSSKGYQFHETKKKENMGWVFYSSFYREQEEQHDGEKPRNGSFLKLSEKEMESIKEKLMQQSDDCIASMEVFDLPAPEPLEKILKAIDENQKLKMLIVYHRQIPYLLPDALKNRGWVAGFIEKDSRIKVYVLLQSLLKEL